ncbi:WD40-repeat-containing domain protein [Obelidium mucronatum]|nr:WD40-repeat-containing domain protein [Obelidium mucronatum]
MSFTLPHQARCIVPQLAEQERPRFFAGTTSVFGGTSADNELRLLDFDEEENEISSQTFSHPNQVRFIAPSPDKSDFVFTCHQNHTSTPNPRASLWLLSALVTNEEDQRLSNQSGTLSELLCIESCDRVAGISKVFWDPSGGKSRVIATGSSAVGVYNIDRGLSKGTIESVYSLSSFSSELNSPSDFVDCAKWNPHNTDEFAVGAEATLIGLDLRAPTNKETFIIPYAHDQCIRDIDYNPNKPYHLATGGNDGKVRIWDSRNHSKPLKELNDHSHWVWSVNYNRFHDQLLLSSSSDCLVNLQNVVSVSSTPYGLIRSMDDELDVVREEGLLEEIKTTDELIATYKEFEDSVYAVAWSSADPWIFASLSFDGRVYINIVPKDVKYSIIL